MEPDVTVICDRDKLDEKGCHGAPDWAVEIVSPSSKTMDYIRKCTLYEQAGVRSDCHVRRRRSAFSCKFVMEVSFLDAEDGL